LNTATAVQFNLVDSVDKTIIEIVPGAEFPIKAFEFEMGAYALSNTNTMMLQ